MWVQSYLQLIKRQKWSQNKALTKRPLDRSHVENNDPLTGFFISRSLLSVTSRGLCQTWTVYLTSTTEIVLNIFKSDHPIYLAYGWLDFIICIEYCFSLLFTTDLQFTS